MSALCFGQILGISACENRQETAEIGRDLHRDAAFYEVSAIDLRILAGHRLAPAMISLMHDGRRAAPALIRAARPIYPISALPRELIHLN
jgi:hypothetical protein